MLQAEGSMCGYNEESLQLRKGTMLLPLSAEVSRVLFQIRKSKSHFTNFTSSYPTIFGLLAGFLLAP